MSFLRIYKYITLHSEDDCIHYNNRQCVGHRLCTYTRFYVLYSRYNDSSIDEYVYKSITNDLEKDE